MGLLYTYTIFAKEELVYSCISLMNEQGVLIVYLSQLFVTQEVILSTEVWPLKGPASEICVLLWKLVLYICDKRTKFN